MDLNELLKLAQTLNLNSQNSNNDNASQNNSQSNNNSQIDYSNNYFKSQFPPSMLNSQVENKTQPIYYQTNSNTSGTLSQSYISPKANLYNQTHTNTNNTNTANQQDESKNQNNTSSLFNSNNNQNIMTFIQSIMPLLNAGNNNPLSNILSSNKKNSTLSSTDLEKPYEDINIDELIKIDDS